MKISSHDGATTPSKESLVHYITVHGEVRDRMNKMRFVDSGQSRKQKTVLSQYNSINYLKLVTNSMPSNPHFRFHMNQIDEQIIRAQYRSTNTIALI